MDYITLSSVIGTGIGTVSIMYSFLRNFKQDIRNEMNYKFDHLEKRMDSFDARMGSFERRIDHIDDRMFFMMTGRTLSQAILEEKMKEKEGRK